MKKLKQDMPTLEKMKEIMHQRLTGDILIADGITKCQALGNLTAYMAAL